MNRDTNFIGGVKELGMEREVAEDDSVKNFLAENGCVKVFNPFLRHMGADDTNRPKDLTQHS